MKRAVVTGLVLGLAMLGFWLGEGGVALREPIWGGAALAGSLMVAVVAPTALRGKVVVGAAAFLVIVATWFIGTHSLARAFNECVARGEEVRGSLTMYREEIGQYPVDLDALGISIPCGRITRPSVLVYEKTAAGYRLSFADWLVTLRATESESFIAGK